MQGIVLQTVSAFRLSRYYDKLAFFYVPNYVPGSSISVLFKSDSV